MFGEYEIELEGSGDPEVRHCGAEGRPALGEEVDLDGVLYSVKRVVNESREEEMPNAPNRKYLVPRLILARISAPERPIGRRPRSDAPPGGRILPWTIPTPDPERGERLSSHYFPPLLLAHIVGHGYFAQCEFYKYLRHDSAVLARKHGRW